MRMCAFAEAFEAQMICGLISQCFDSDSFDCIDREHAVPLSSPSPRLGPLGLERLVERAEAFTHPDLQPSEPTCRTWITGYGWRGPAGPDEARGDGES